MSLVEIVKMIFPLLIIIAMLGVVLWYVKKLTHTKVRGATNPLGVKVISNHSIMPKKFVSVVKVRDKYLILGLSDTSIELLKEMEVLPEDEVVTENENNNNFFEILKRNMLPK